MNGEGLPRAMHWKLHNEDLIILGACKLLPSKTLEKFTFFNFHEIIASS